MSSNSDRTLIIKSVKDYYSDKIRTHGATPLGVDWNSAETQELRFRQLSMLFPASGFSVTDLGCGYGGFYEFLASQADAFEYVGVDISADMIQEGTSLHGDRPNCRFVCADRPTERTDYVVASGIFNVRQHVSDEAWLRYLFECIDTMDASSKSGFAFNCLTSYSDENKKRDYLYYADPCILFDHCMRYSRHVTLLHGYGLYEFTILVRKESGT